MSTMDFNAMDFVTPQIMHGPVLLGDGTIQWNVWVTRSDRVSLVLMDADHVVAEVPMECRGHGLFVSAPRKVSEEQRYGFRLGDGSVRPDPASRWQPDGVHKPSAVWSPDSFQWTDRRWKGIPRTDLVIYELHVGTFTDERTFDAIIPRLPALVELGVNAIEVMPVAQFPGDRNWGYDGVHPYAVQNTYGGPRGLQRLVDACHQSGVAVILDVVYNHFGPEGNYLNEFGPYFTDQYLTPWGSALNFDQAGNEGVRAFVLENVRYWVRDFHVDGLRLDAVHAIFDSSPCHILREIKEVADEEAARRGWPVQIIAESDRNDVRLLDKPEKGLGLDAVWSDDFHHAVHAFLTNERQGYYVDFGSASHLSKALNQSFVYDGVHSVFRGHSHGTKANQHSGDRFVVCIQNHDQVGNRTRGDRFGTILSPAKQRLAAGLLLTAPHIPMLFMGEEYGETRPFPYFCSFLDQQLVDAIRRGRTEEHAAEDSASEGFDPQAESTFDKATLGWAWPDDSHSAGLRRLYRDLLSLRRRWPVFRDFHNRRADLFPSSDSPQVLRFVRAATIPHAAGAMVAYFNMTGREQQSECAHHHESGLIFSSEASRYRGQRGPDEPVQSLLPYEFQIYGPTCWKQL